MTNSGKIRGLVVAAFLVIFTTTFANHPINDYFKQHKNDPDMEAKVVPPKMASLFVDEDYPEAIDLLQSMTSLKYLNYYGDKSKIEQYANNAISAKGSYKSLLDEVDGTRVVKVYGEKKKGTVRKIMAVVQTKSQFLLIIGTGKLTNKQIQGLPELSKEIQ
ncbi:MAG: DUF4252 domain-containing protein [Crocinitomicaceae bacterium]|nr:DUF4252 domain-containing protein [Crocinitomicaceae bacterium]